MAAEPVSSKTDITANMQVPLELLWQGRHAFRQTCASDI